MTYQFVATNAAGKRPNGHFEKKIGAGTAKLVVAAYQECVGETIEETGVHRLDAGQMLAKLLGNPKLAKAQKEALAALGEGVIRKAAQANRHVEIYIPADSRNAAYVRVKSSPQQEPWAQYATNKAIAALRQLGFRDIESEDDIPEAIEASALIGAKTGQAYSPYTQRLLEVAEYAVLRYGAGAKVSFESVDV